MHNALLEARPRDNAQRIFHAMGAVEPAFFRHSALVAEGAALLGTALGLSAMRLRRLEEAAWLHDVLLSDSEVSPTELVEHEAFRTHPTLGAVALRNHGVSEPVCQIVEQHHEGWNGEGFPRGLKGEAIVLEARIIALADALAHLGPQMVSPAFPGWASMAERLLDGAGKLWDPYLVAVFLNACRRRPCDRACPAVQELRLAELRAELDRTGPRACGC